MKHLKLTLVAALLAAPLASRAQEKVTFDASGWAAVSAFSNRGDLSARELPTFARGEGIEDRRSFGMAARQSRIRAVVGVPADGLLQGATLKGLVEADFMGGAGSTTDSSNVLPRLRHYFLQATFKNVSNLSFLVGQTWGLAGGNYFSESLAHLAMPRFGGAGFIFRRAPQARISSDLPLSGPLSFNVAAAALMPGDTAAGFNTGTGAPNLNQSVGNDSAFPNLEARVTGVYKQDNKPLAEVGLWTHYGREKYEVAAGGGFGAQDYTAISQAFGADLRLTFPYVMLVASGFTGQNLDVLSSIAGTGIVSAASAAGGQLADASDPANVKAREMETMGGFAQAIVTPVKGFQLLAGMGVENPDDDTLKLPSATAVADNRITKNTQYSAGTIVSLTSKWRVSFEATRYVTQVALAADPRGYDVVTGTQFELGSLIAF